MIYALLLAWTDPYRSFGFFPRLASFHDSFILRKAEVLLHESPQDVETLVLGSSTSEAFYPVDIEDLFGGPVFTASTGGGNTPVRLSFAFLANQAYPELKRLIYVVDFFEFHQSKAPGELLFAQLFEPALDYWQIQERSFYHFLKFHFTHAAFESVINVLRRAQKNDPIHLNRDGTTERSMVLSPLPDTIADQTELTAPQKKFLDEQIQENFHTYSQKVFKGFERLNPETLRLFQALNEFAGQHGFEILYVLAPYHPDFKEKLFKMKNFRALYQEWIEFFTQLETLPHITVINPTEESLPATAWRDGIHFNRTQARSFLKKAIVND